MAKLLLERGEVIREGVWRRFGGLAAPLNRLHHLGLGVGVIAHASAHAATEITRFGEVELGATAARSARGLRLCGGCFDICGIERGHAEHGLLPAFLQLVPTKTTVD
jgi:hypothetical protein